LELFWDTVVFLVVFLEVVFVEDVKDFPELAVIFAVTGGGVVPGVGVDPHANAFLGDDVGSRHGVVVGFLVGFFAHFWQEVHFLLGHDVSLDDAVFGGSGFWVKSRIDESFDSSGTADLGLFFGGWVDEVEWFGLEDPAFQSIILKPLVAPWHEGVFGDDLVVVFIAASEPEETVFPGWFSEWAVVGTVFDHFDVISTGPPFVVKGRDVEVVGVTFAFFTSELRWDNWFKQLWVVKVQGLGAVGDGSFFVTLWDTVLRWVLSGVGVPTSTEDSGTVELGDTWESDVLPQVDELGELLFRDILRRDFPDVVGLTVAGRLKVQIVDGGVVHEWVQVEAVPEEPGAILGSFELIGFLDPEFVLVVEDKEDVVVAPWDGGDFFFSLAGKTKVWVVTAVWVDFALVGGDVFTKVVTALLPLFWLDQSTSVEVHHFEVDEVKFLSWVSTFWEDWNIWLGNGGEAAWVDLSGGGHDEHFLHFGPVSVSTLGSKEKRSGHWVNVAVFDHRVDVELFGISNTEHKRHGFDRHLAAFSHPLDEGKFLVGRFVTAVGQDRHDVRWDSHLLVKLKFNEFRSVSGLSVLHPLVFWAEVSEKLFLQKIFDVDGSLWGRFWQLLFDHWVHLHHHQVGDSIDTAFDIVVRSTPALGSVAVATVA